MQKLKTDALNRLSTDEFKKAEKVAVIVVLDNVRSALNIGSVFRTCDAFLIEAIYLVGICATPPNRDIQKSALGATETVTWKYFENIKDCIASLREQQYELLTIEQSDKSVQLHEFFPNPDKKYAFIFGNEVDGVSDFAMQYCNASIEVPQFGMKHSMNVSVCAGIVLWEIIRKLKLSNSN